MFGGGLGERGHGCGGSDGRAIADNEAVGYGWWGGRWPWTARIVSHEPTYRKSRAFVSYVTWSRALRYEPARMVSSFAELASSFAELVSRVVEMVTVARSWVRGTLNMDKSDGIGG